jgi:hypothetical protein
LVERRPTAELPPDERGAIRAQQSLFEPPASEPAAQGEDATEPQSPGAEPQPPEPERPPRQEADPVAGIEAEPVFDAPPPGEFGRDPCSSESPIGDPITAPTTITDRFSDDE